VRRILLTGAAGGVGRAITPMLKTLYPGLVLSDLDPPENTHGLPFVRADLADMAATQAAVAGADGIIHLGGYSVEGPWETILSANIVGCRNMFEASRLAGVRRIVFASSNHVVGFYPRSEKIAQDVTVLPDTRYGVSKAFGEALGAMYAMKHGIGVACLRIGNVGETPLDMRRMSILLHPEDLVQLIAIGLDHPDIVFEVFYGASDNARGWWDNSRAHAFGYKPKHGSEPMLEIAMREQSKLAPDPIGDRFQGGSFCSIEYSNEGPGRKST
jgi:uronate dehydrogenase